MENSPARILIIDTAWLGDVIFTTALIGSAKRLWPEAEVYALTAPRGEEILRGNPNIREVFVYDKHGQQSSLPSLLAVASRLRAVGLDLILNAHPSFRSRLLTRLIGAPVRVGYRGFGARFCFTHIVANDLAVQPDHVQRRLDLLRAVWSPSVYGGIKGGHLEVPVTSESSVWAEEFLRERGCESKPLLALIPGSAWETKQWPASHYADLARRWIEERHGSVLVFGGEKERSTVEAICTSSFILHPSSFPPHPSFVIPVLSEPIPRVTALLKRCEVAVGNDTGVTFLAVAVGGPKVLALFGCTQVDYALPAPHRAITAGVPCCLPRTGHGAHRCQWSDEPWCMSQIEVERVWEIIGGSSSE